MLRLLASGLVAGVLVSGGSAWTAPSDGAPPIVDTSDRHGDVKVHGTADTLDPAIIGSVDVRHVTVTRQAHGVRAVVRLKEVLPPKGRYIQQVGFSLITRGEPSWIGNAPGSLVIAIAILQHVGGAAAVYLDDIAAEGPEGEEDLGEEPLICHVSAKKGARVVSLEIPDRCLPPDPGQLIVSTLLLDKRNLEGDLAYIEDDLTVRGQVDLRP